MCTQFPELDEVLTEFVEGVRSLLGGNLAGIYLQGSFAIGDADEWSDVDFVVVTETALGDGDRPSLDALHERVYHLPSRWAAHLEGSYIDRGLLRTVDVERTPLLFLDHGAQHLTWDDHCNTAYVRWTLREHGVVLAGPRPVELIDPVAADALREEGRERIPEWAEWAFSSTEMSRWKQPHLVLSLCRILYTIETGTVASKRVAGEWAIRELDPEWRSLIRQALDDRPDPVGRSRQWAEQPDVARTLDFVRYASSARS
jgi:predicted nucleotidyltransferase